MTNDTAGILEDVKISAKLKLSALWVAMLFLYTYGDIFGLYQPGRIETIQVGQVSIFQINQAVLLGSSVYIFIPSIMIFLSLVLKPTVNRWKNIVLGIVYMARFLLSCIGETWMYYLFLSITESAFLVLLIWYAWNWPKAEAYVHQELVSPRVTASLR